MDNRKIGERLLKLRQGNKLSQTEFALKLGISQPAYKNYEHGDREIPASILLTLFSKFGIDPLRLLTGDEIKVTHSLPLLEAAGKAVEYALEKSGDKVAKSKKWEMISFVYLQAIKDGAVNEMLASTLASIGGNKDV